MCPTFVLMQIKSGFDFWVFMENTAVPVLYWAKLYSGKNTVRKDRQYLDDMYSFRVGSVRLRQNRVVPGKCMKIQYTYIYFKKHYVCIYMKCIYYYRVTKFCMHLLVVFNLAFLLNRQ